MKKSLAQLNFTSIDGNKLSEQVKSGAIWRTITKNCDPNNWSLQIVFIEDPQKDNTIMAEISFLMPDAEYLLKTGTKFKLFEAFTNHKWEVKIIKEL
jgi:hypothetical protein